MDIKAKHQKRRQRHKRVRAKIFGTSEVPRLCVFRSNKHIYAQLIDDEKERILASASDLKTEKVKEKNQKLKIEKEARAGKEKIAFEIGKLIAEKALKKKVKRVVFDRGGYKYHGRVKAVAEGARKGGISF